MNEDLKEPPNKVEARKQSSPDLATLVRNISPKKAWIVGIGFLLLVFWLFYPSSDAGNLELRTKNGLVGGSLWMTNVGADSYKIIGISINDRKDCYPFAVVGPSNNFVSFPTEIKTGDRLLMDSRCQVVRVVVKTDKGDLAYSFK